jgi:two-component system cell cycle sensor histidine kinase/response regulator CckA
MTSIVASNNRSTSLPQPPAPLYGATETSYQHVLGIEGPKEELEARTRQLSLLAEINVALASALDVESVLGQILKRLADREKLSYARIYRLDAAVGQLREVARASGDRGYRPVVPVEKQTHFARAIRQREAVYIPFADADADRDSVGPKAQCIYAVPLHTGERIFGVLDVASDCPDGIRYVTRKLIDQVATQAALALERSELYQQLRVSEERFRSIFEQVYFGVGLAALDGRFSTVNPALARLLGFTCEELQGKHFAEITHPDDTNQKRERLDQLLAKGQGQVSFEARYLRKSGESLWCATNISLLHDAAGRPAWFLGMVQDIDQRKKAEAERDRLQRQLFQAQKMEALGTLAGGIAHDFNNLLSVMLGFASLARQRLRSDDPLQDSMGMIEQSAHRAAELARQLLGFARPERQQLKPVCVDEVLERIRRMIQRTFDRNIAVAVLKGSESLWVNAEPSYLEQALLNMCINARDAMPRGGTLTLSESQQAVAGSHPTSVGDCLAGQYVTISIQDTGLGIAPETLPRVFEPFFTTKESGRGTGLGLAMVYGFVKTHGGFVNVESEPGNGAQFTISLPRVPAPSASAPAGVTGRIQPGSGTVLVADDEPLVRAFAAAGLKALGYNVLVAENGKQALQIYEQHQTEIDYVLLDLIMPELSGLEAFRHMRMINPRVRVVFASGYSTGEILRDAPDAQAAAFVGKPYTLQVLSSALHKAAAANPPNAE